MAAPIALAIGASGCTKRPDPGSAAPAIPVGDKLMVQLGPGLYAEPDPSESDRRELLAAYATALAQVTKFFGPLRKGPPLVLFCRSAACKIVFGAPPESASATDLGFARDGLQTQAGYLVTPMVVATGPVGKTAKILTHEMVHAEMKSYTPYDSLPTWFNEGMATWIAGEPDCSGNPPISNFDVRLLDTKTRWQEHIRTPGVTLRTYCLARDEAGRWAEQQAEPQVALKALLQAVAQGTPFATAAAAQ